MCAGACAITPGCQGDLLWPTGMFIYATVPQVAGNTHSTTTTGNEDALLCVLFHVSAYRNVLIIQLNVHAKHP